jgi:hypothetical protein
MNDERSTWWWLPSTLMTLAGLLFYVAATYSNTAVWVTLGIVMFIVAGMNFRRRHAASRL